jgi:uncharacterized protein YdeI (YjbR/CyaY-like superfamily)
MPTLDPRVDAYIDRSADFAKPILRRIRKLVHEAYPDIEETMKWSFPHFVHKGTVCSMASFKQHCAFGFWKQSLMEDKAFPAEKTAMGSFGRITSPDDLPDDKTMLALIKQAVKLNEDGVKVPRSPKQNGKRELIVPDDLKKRLSADKKAAAVFEKFPYSQKKEYVEWIEEAKTDATRQKRLATTLEWLAEGKGRNWKYERK